MIAVGRLAPEKRLIDLLDAFAMISSRDTGAPHLVLVGDGPDRAALEQRVSAADLVGRVHLVGPRTDALRWIASADALALVSEREGLPTVVIEALAAGTPVVMTRFPGAPAVLLDLLSPSQLAAVGDPTAIAAAIAAALDRGRAAPERARSEVEPFRSDFVAARWRELLHQWPSEPAAVGLYVVGHDRPVDVAEAFASASGFDLAERRLLDNASELPLAVPDGVVATRSEENLGVTGGRNRVTEGAAADLLVYLDDDAVLLGDPVPELRRAFASDPDLGAVAFSVRRPDGTIESSEWPFRGAPRDPDVARPCAYFVGAGYAVRRCAIDQVGGYDERYFYSTEEIDLSMRLIGAGWTLAYRPSIAVEHRPASTGRGIRPAVPALRLRNRIQYARSHLPLPVALVHGSIWAIRTFREARAASSLLLWSASLREGLTAPVPRHPLRWRQLVEVHRWGGRVWW